MAYRGRLIFPVTAEIARLELVSTTMDPDYREPVLSSSSDGLGSVGRAEDLIRIQAQIDTKSAERLTMLASGDTKSTYVVLICHFTELEAQGLIDSTTGRALLKPSDRLNALYEADGTLIHSYPDPPGVFARDATPIGIGLGGKRNLLRLVFQSRDRGI